MPTESPLPYLWMLLGALSFAAMSTLVTGLGPACDWQTIAIVRTFLAMTFAAGLATASRVRLVVFRPATLWMRSLAGSCSLVCGFFALTRLPTTEVLALTNMFPIWVALLSWPMLGTRPPRDVWPAVGCGVAGVWLMHHLDLTRGNYVWLVALASSLFSAIALIGLHKLQKLDPRVIVTHFSAVSLGFAVCAWFVFPRRAEPIALHVEQLVMLLGVGVTATIGQIFLTKAFAAGSPERVSVVGLSQVGFGLVLELLFFDRTYDAQTIIGILLVLAPTAWLMLRAPLRRVV